MHPSARTLSRGLALVRVLVRVLVLGVILAGPAGLLPGVPVVQPASAQHAHGDTAAVVVAHDANPAGYEFVGNVAHFGILDLGDDLVPDFHQQNHIRVLLNGAVLLETTPDSGHDYDGVNLFDVVFPVAGAYAVQALNETGAVLAQFNGTVVDVPREDLLPAAITLVAPATVTPGQSATYAYSLRDANDRILPHTDANFEIADAFGVLLRTKTHTHADEQRVEYAYMGRTADFTATVTAYVAYPGPGVTLVEPVAAEAKVTVLPDAPPAPSAPGVPVVPDAPFTNAVVHGEPGTYQLLGTYDPWTTVGPTTQMRLTSLVMDPATREPVQHVDFAATLTSRTTGAVLFSSETLHEYDGIWEFATTQSAGEYVLGVTASREGWTSTIDMPFSVVPPALAVLPGDGTVPVSSAAPQQTVSVTGLQGLVAGQTFNLTIAIADASGEPLEHAEVDAMILDPNRIPVIATKLHTHDSGAYQLRSTLPAGTYSLRLHPFPLEPRPAFQYVHASCEAPHPSLCPLTEIPFTVADGPGLPAAPATQTAAATQSTPAPAFALAVCALATLAVALRRRT